MAAPFRIIRFWTDYATRDGKIHPVDKVEYCAPGNAQRSTTVAVVSHLSCILHDVDPDNPAHLLARQRWEFMKPAYEAWKQGQETPAHGTPLAAWAGITPQQAEVMRSFGLRCVEDIAEASDGVLGRVQLPGMRDIADSAKRFLASRDQVAVAETMGKMQAENDELREQLEEMRRMIIEGQQADEDAPRRRGRPPKVRDEAPDEVAA